MIRNFLSLPFYRWLLVALLVPLAHADLGGKNVILIHGFQPQHLLAPPSDNGYADAQNYWRSANGALKQTTSGLSNIVYWPSHKRLTGAGGIISIVQPQLAALIDAGHCDQECIIVTHSTGDMVTRFLLKNKQSIFGSARANRFKVAAVVDLAGAGGGTELANYGVGIANGVNFGADIINGLLDYAGFSIRLGLDVGVMYDLQPSVARNHATGSFPAIPHLRVAGTGDEFYGFATHPLIKGADDSVVPLHSACGVAVAGDYDSCSRDVRIDGKLTTVWSAPYFSQLYDYHYPLVMSESLAHNAMQSSQTGNSMTYITSVEAQYLNGAAYSIALQFDDYTQREWWDFFNKYRYLRDAEYYSTTSMLVRSL